MHSPLRSNRDACQRAAKSYISYINKLLFIFSIAIEINESAMRDYYEELSRPNTFPPDFEFEFATKTVGNIDDHGYRSQSDTLKR